MRTEGRYRNLTIRLDPDLREAVESAAAADRRPLGNFIRVAIEETLARRAATQRTAIPATSTP